VTDIVIRVVPSGSGVTVITVVAIVVAVVVWRVVTFVVRGTVVGGVVAVVTVVAGSVVTAGCGVTGRGVAVVDPGTGWACPVPAAPADEVLPDITCVRSGDRIA
jgi:hypothetical protein